MSLSVLQGRPRNPKKALGELWQKRMMRIMGGGEGGACTHSHRQAERRAAVTRGEVVRLSLRPCWGFGVRVCCGYVGKKSWVVKATSKEAGPPKAKYVRKIVLAVWEHVSEGETHHDDADEPKLPWRPAV